MPPIKLMDCQGATITSRGVSNAVRIGCQRRLPSIPAAAWERNEWLTKPKPRQVVLDPLVNNNPIALQVLGICSALAVTTKLETSLVMCAAVISGAGLLERRHQSHSQLRPQQHSHHCSDDDHRLVGDLRG